MPDLYRTSSHTGQSILQYSHKINMEWYKITIKFLSRDIQRYKLSQDPTKLDKRMGCGIFNQILQQSFEI